MTPLQIKLAIYAAMALIIIGSYLAWEHHVKSIQREIDRAEVLKRDADTARQSAELMAAEKTKVEQSNNEQTERLQNAITIYATRTTELNSDVDNLVSRMRNIRAAASCSKNAMPERSDNNQKREERNNGADYVIAAAAAKLANLCEKKINELEVKN